MIEGVSTLDQPTLPIVSADPPAGSTITREHDFQGDTLSWTPDAEGCFGRLVAGGFLLGWLIGWAAGEFFAASALLAMLFGIDVFGNPKSEPFEWMGAIFLSGWLLGWTFGGMAAMYALVGILKGPNPEIITLTRYTLGHDTGGGFFSMTQGDEDAVKPAKPRKLEVDREALSPFVLDRTGERQRLTFDHNSKRREIGTTLDEPDREWLWATLERWRRA